MEAVGIVASREQDRQEEEEDETRSFASCASSLEVGDEKRGSFIRSAAPSPPPSSAPPRSPSPTSSSQEKGNFSTTTLASPINDIVFPSIPPLGAQVRESSSELADESVDSGWRSEEYLEGEPEGVEEKESKTIIDEEGPDVEEGEIVGAQSSVPSPILSPIQSPSPFSSSSPTLVRLLISNLPSTFTNYDLHRLLNPLLSNYLLLDVFLVINNPRFSPYAYFTVDAGDALNVIRTLNEKEIFGGGNRLRVVEAPTGREGSFASPNKKVEAGPNATATRISRASPQRGSATSTPSPFSTPGRIEKCAIDSLERDIAPAGWSRSGSTPKRLRFS